MLICLPNHERTCTTIEPCTKEGNIFYTCTFVMRHLKAVEKTHPASFFSVIPAPWPLGTPNFCTISVVLIRIYHYGIGKYFQDISKLQRNKMFQILISLTEEILRLDQYKKESHHSIHYTHDCKIPFSV